MEPSGERGARCGEEAAHGGGEREAAVGPGSTMLNGRLAGPVLLRAPRGLHEAPRLGLVREVGQCGVAASLRAGPGVLHWPS